MRCDEVRKLLIEYSDGELAPDERAAVREHVESCTSCRAELDALERVRVLLADDGYAAPDPFYWTRFSARLRDRMRREGLLAGGDRRWARLVPRLAPVAVALVCFALGMWAGLRPALEHCGPEAVVPAGSGRAYVSSPVISPRSKLLVEAGDTAVDEQPLTYAADTLAPEHFGPLGSRGEMVLASEEHKAGTGRSVARRVLGE